MVGTSLGIKLTDLKSYMSLSFIRYLRSLAMLKVIFLKFESNKYRVKALYKNIINF